MREPMMQGRGYYNQHSELQARSAAEADGMLERALAAVAIRLGRRRLRISVRRRATTLCAR